MPSLHRMISSSDFTVQPFGDQSHNFDVFFTWTGTTLETELPWGEVKVKFTTTDQQTWTYTKHYGRSVTATLTRSGDTLTLTTDLGDRILFAIPSGFNWSQTGQKLRATRIEGMRRAPTDLIYDGNGRLVQVNEPLGSIGFQYGQVGVDGVITSTTLPDGRTVTYSYTILGGRPRLSTVTYPDGSQDVSSTDLTPVSLPNYSFTFTKTRRRAVNSIPGRSRDVVSWYDSRGLCARIEDALGRPLYQRESNGSFAGLFFRANRDRNGRLRYTFFNNQGALTRIFDPVTGYDLLFANDDDRKQHGWGDELGRRHMVAYASGTFMPISHTFPDGTVSSVTVNGASAITSETDRVGHTRFYTRNAQGRTVDFIEPDGTPGTTADNPHRERHFNAFAQVTREIDELGRETRYFYAMDGDPAHAALWCARNCQRTADRLRHRPGRSAGIRSRRTCCRPPIRRDGSMPSPGMRCTARRG